MIVKATSARRQRRFEEERLLNSELANLVAFAYHQPKQIPKYEPLQQARREEPSEADDAYVRAFFIGMAKAGEAG